MPQSTVTALAAKALLEAAKAHKRAAKASRSAARKCMQDLEALKQRCRAEGIALEVA